jgi:hypothetical protein
MCTQCAQTPEQVQWFSVKVVVHREMQYIYFMTLGVRRIGVTKRRIPTDYTKWSTAKQFLAFKTSKYDQISDIFEEYCRFRE